MGPPIFSFYNRLYLIYNSQPLGVWQTLRNTQATLKLTGKIHRFLVRLSRMPRTRGFGVQSPTAYRFIRYVVSEHSPYYQYATLAKQYPHDRHTRRLCELMFRLANYSHAYDWLQSKAQLNLFTPYIKSGHRRVQVKTINSLSEIEQLNKIGVLQAGYSADCEQLIKAALKKVSPTSMFIIHDIYLNDEMRRLWRSLEQSPICIITIDLYECGIILFDDKVSKQSYKTNF